MTRRIRAIAEQAVAAAGGLTVPRPDIARSDQAVERALLESRVFRAVDVAAAGGERAWRNARTRTRLLPAAADWRAWSAVERVRTIGVATAVAGVTAVVAGVATPRPADPLAWVLPAAMACLGLFTSIAAGAVRRAIADKTS